MGGWKFMCFLQYIKLSFGACSFVTDTLSNPSLLTMSHLRKQYNPRPTSVPSKYKSSTNTTCYIVSYSFTTWYTMQQLAMVPRRVLGGGNLAS